ncbi:MAG: hypothetical protein OCU12_06320 [Methanophagales archaeon]|nr:hypothetical protein [Methanophagales archaeon]
MSYSKLLLLVLLLFFVLSCAVAEGAQLATTSTSAGITAQGAAQSALAGAVVASDVQSQIEGSAAEDWEMYHKAKALEHARRCVELQRNKDPQVGSCTAYYCSDVGELTIVCEIEGSDDVLFTYANSQGCFTWARADRRIMDSERFIRYCEYFKTL